MNEEFDNAVKTASGWSIALAVLMIILGIVAIGMPFVTGITASVFFAWVVLVGAIFYFIYAFSAEGAAGLIWRLLISVLYLIGAFYLMFNPGMALAGLTLAFAIMFVVEGILQLIGFFAVRGIHGAGWLLFDGIVSVALGAFIANGWPENSVWLLGTIIGVNLMFSGFNRLMYSTALRGLTSHHAH